MWEAKRLLNLSGSAVHKKKKRITKQRGATSFDDAVSKWNGAAFPSLASSDRSRTNLLMAMRPSAHRRRARLVERRASHSAAKGEHRTAAFDGPPVGALLSRSDPHYCSRGSTCKTKRTQLSSYPRPQTRSQQASMRSGSDLVPNACCAHLLPARCSAVHQQASHAQHADHRHRTARVSGSDELCYSARQSSPMTRYIS